MPDSETLFAGTWELLPELCPYEEGEPPRSGLCSIIVADDAVSFSIHWTDSAGKAHSAAFGGPLDGARHSTGMEPITETSYASIDSCTLDSSAFAGDVLVQYARRRASADGQLLAVVQQHRRTDGSTYRNFQVYRRVL